ncbi:MAG: AIPR family protein [Geminicoccaceae bacterium]|nr:AIPR family protein [Geminicoccaceae bacterium]
MSDEHELGAFIRGTGGEIDDRCGETGDFRENVFTAWVAEYLEEAGITAGVSCVFHESRAGQGLARINGYALDEEERRLDLLATLFQDATTPVTVPTADMARAAGQAARFFGAALKGLDERLEPGSEAAAMARQIRDAGGWLKDVQVRLLTDGRSAARGVKPLRVGDWTLHFDIWDIERLFRAMQAGRPQSEIAIDLEEHGGAIPCLPLPQAADAYAAYLAVLPGELLYRLYERYGARLLELNVRSFLSARGKVNKGIRETLRKEPERFLAYNNGLVMTADAVELTTLPDGRPAIRGMRGLQIVNGGQTTASVHRARKVDRSDIGRVLVAAKIAVIDPAHQEAMVKDISRHANTQNVVQVADFSANEAFHVALERLSRGVWCPGERGRWFYERARGQYQVEKAQAEATTTGRRKFKEQTPPARRFVKTDVARYRHAWEQKPYLIARGSQKNFDVFMQDLKARKGDWVPDEAWYRDLIAVAILYRAVETVVRKSPIAAYRANVVAYTVCAVVDRSGSGLGLERVWREQALSPELTGMLRDWAPRVHRAIVESAQGRNVTEWAKKEGCWERVRSLDLPFPAPLPPELAVRSASAPGQTTRRDGSLAADDLDNMACCKRLSGEAWLKVSAEGQRRGVLQPWEAQLAVTLSGLAAHGWQKGLSPRQALHGARIARLAEQAGIIGDGLTI